FDTATTLWDALTRIARVGRAMPMYYAGVIDFIRNEPKSVKTQMYTPGNIVTSTFSIDYAFPPHDSPDHVIVEFVNEETWQPDEVLCALPDSLKMRPFRLQLPGVTNREQAWREGISLAAQNRDQRRFVSFQTELEGMIPRYADLVEISHDVPKWGLSGFIESYDPDTKTLVTSEPLEWWAGENHYINLRKRDGSPDGPYRVVAGGHDREMVIEDAIDGHSVFVSDGQGEEFTLYQFGPGERRALLAQVVAATPDEEGHVAIEFVNYAPSVHSAEHGGVVPPPTPPSLLPSNPNAPVVDSVTVYAAAVPGQQVVSATPARGADRYEFRASEDAGATWIDLGTHLSSTITSTLQAGVWRVQARGIGTMQGPWATWQGIVSATMVPPPALESLTASPEIMAIRLDWTLPAAPWIRSVEIWYSTDDDFLNASLLGEFRPTQRSHTLYGLGYGTQMWFWARIRDEADQAGPWYPDVTGPGVSGTSSTDATALLEYLSGKINEGSLAPGLAEQIAEKAAEGIAEEIVGDLTGDDVLDEKWYAGDDDEQGVFVGTVTTTSATNEGDYYQAKRTTSLIAQVDDSLAVIREVQIVQASETSALANQVTTLAAQVGPLEAVVQESIETVAELDGALRATYQMKAQVRAADGRVAWVGSAMGAAINADGTVRSEIILAADLIALAATAEGPLVYPFIFDTVQQTAVLNAAIIGNGTVSFLKVGDDVQSTDYIPGQRGWRLAKGGAIEFNGPVAGGGRLTMSNQLIQVFDPNNVLRVRLGIW
ncbi:MAG: host specificity factor TipJ family phage tail protein, partial [Corticimicrobacter sp.]|uniref:host specificity factor TipJ family phage tail protein n=1 Tax=Corticimicrobacter sp. TaxID=2678536 RepID=UPI0032DAFDAF